MAVDPTPDRAAAHDTWRGDFQSAEERLLDASLIATPSQRLMWLEQALAFAAKIGALPTHDNRVAAKRAPYKPPKAAKDL